MSERTSRQLTWHPKLSEGRIQALGPAGHHAPEDAPHEIAEALKAWLPK